MLHAVADEMAAPLLKRDNSGSAVKMAYLVEHARTSVRFCECLLHISFMRSMTGTAVEAGLGCMGYVRLVLNGQATTWRS
jgi:hypothetical protein